MASLPIFRPAHADPADRAFTLVPVFNIGQVRRFRLDIEQHRQGALAWRGQMDNSLTVLNRDGEGWTLAWCIDRFALFDAPPDMRPLLEALGQFTVGMPVVFRVDAAGQVLGLADVPTLQQDMTHAATQALAAARAADPDHALLAQMQPMMLALVGNPAVLDQTLLKEPRMLLGGLGRSFQVGEGVEVRTAVPSLLGTGTVPVLGRFEVRAVRPRAKEVELGWLMVIDTQAALAAASRELAPFMPAGQAPALGTLDFDDRATLVIDVDTALPVRGEHLRRMDSGGHQRLERVRWERLPG